MPTTRVRSVVDDCITTSTANVSDSMVGDSNYIYIRKHSRKSSLKTTCNKNRKHTRFLRFRFTKQVNTFYVSETFSGCYNLSALFFVSPHKY